MNLLELKNKLEKGKSLGGEVVYIKEESLISGIESIYKDQEEKKITLLKSNEETIRVDDLLKLLDELYASIGDGEVFTGNNEYFREECKDIQSLEFAQYELIKMIFINI
ncbi:MAG: hypothetical protein RRZ84_04635 [Romboutsia sp.]